MEHIIDGKNIVKTYGNTVEKQVVLNNISVSVGAGEFVTIMGPSGSGKTTLLYALSGMDAIDEGSVYFDETLLSDLKEEELADVRRQKMGFVFQQPTFLKNLNLIDNIMLPALRDIHIDRAELTQKAKVLMEKVGIGNLAERNITQVSGGQLQRAGICRALMGNPDIIFGDEPTGALNSKSAEEIMDILTTIHQEKTAILLVTHDAKVAARAERVLFMKDGSIAHELHFEEELQPNMLARAEQIAAVMNSIEI